MYSFSQIVKNDTSYLFENGVYRVIQEPFTSQLEQFLKGYYEHAKPQKITEDYSKLPFVPGNAAEWKFRQASLKVMNNLLTQKNYGSFLEIGPWNGWLTHHLSAKINKGVAADLFNDEVNGLAAIKHYPNAQWLPVQCDIESMDLFTVKFDLIILNHCVQFFQDYRKAIQKIKALLAKGGTLVILGISVYKDASEKQKDVENMQRSYFDRTGKNLYFRPSKGYFDASDKHWLEKEEFSFTEYSVFHRHKFLAAFDKKLPRFYYALYEQ
jgi:SAM-dependent methyltransferase